MTQLETFNDNLVIYITHAVPQTTIMAGIGRERCRLSGAEITSPLENLCPTLINCTQLTGKKMAF